MASKFIFDQRMADAAVEFFPKFLCFVEGEWAGKPFHLSPWEEKHTRQIFGWRRRADGRRRYRFVRGWIPRKNGKSCWAAGVGHLLTIGDGEPGAQVYSHALDRAQASVVFETASRMAQLSPALSSLYEVNKTGLFCPGLMAGFRPLTGEALGKHGLSPHANIGDEAHAWRDGRLHTFLVQGMGARRQPLDLTISTAGEVKTYGHELYTASRRILDDPDTDPETYVFCYEADKDADWTSPDVWAAANPNLGISLKLEFLEAECKRAMQSPRLENDFRRYHLNQWVEQLTRWFPMRKWGENTRDAADVDLWRKLRDQLRGRACYGGIDLGSTDDITALIWCFPPQNEGDRTILLPRFWVPAAKLKQDQSKPDNPYARWARMGALEATPGDVTDYDFIEQAVMEDCERFRCLGIAIDRWNATQVAVHLGAEGLPVNLFGQGYASMGAPSKEMERRFLQGTLEHGSHPIMKWMFGNATYRKDPAGNIKPDKERASDKIDGVVAAVMALGLSCAAAENAGDKLAKAILARGGLA